MPPKRYRDVYLKEETYQKLLQLKAVLGKRSVNDVVEELLKCVTVNTVSSPVNTVSFTVSTGKVTVSTVNSPVSTGESPVSTVSPTVNTVKHGEDPSDDELSKKLEALDKKLDMLAKELRKQQDLIVAYTGKADQVLQRLSQLVEAFEALSEKLDRVAEVLSKQQVLERAEEKPSVSEEREKQRKGAKHEKTTICEILDKQLVLFESEIADKIRNKDAFFSAVESKCNDIVIEGLKERIAVEKTFWQQFLDKLSNIGTSDEEKIKSLLDPLEFRLFSALKESALIVFNANEKKWKLIADSATKAGT